MPPVLGDHSDVLAGAIRLALWQAKRDGCTAFPQSNHFVMLNAFTERELTYRHGLQRAVRTAVGPKDVLANLPTRHVIQHIVRIAGNRWRTEPAGFKICQLRGQHGHPVHCRPLLPSVFLFSKLSEYHQVGLLNGIPVSFLSSAAPWTFSNGSTGQDAILDSINFIANQTKKPTVVSTSYAQPEEMYVACSSSVCSLNPHSRVSGSLAASVKICNAFAALGAQGVSLLYGSGDGGVGGMGDSTCTTFKATFPSGCPYVSLHRRPCFYANP
jgi:hypothetical protein